jgi:hypothetical protein
MFAVRTLSRTAGTKRFVSTSTHRVQQAGLLGLKAAGALLLTAAFLYNNRAENFFGTTTVDIKKVRKTTYCCSLNDQTQLNYSPMMTGKG